MVCSATMGEVGTRVTAIPILGNLELNVVKASTSQSHHADASLGQTLESRPDLIVHKHADRLCSLRRERSGCLQSEIVKP